MAFLNNFMAFLNFYMLHIGYITKIILLTLYYNTPVLKCIVFCCTCIFLFLHQFLILTE